MLRRDSKLSLTIQGQEDPLEKEMTIQSSIIAWEVPCTKPDGLQSVHEVTKESDITYQLNKNNNISNYTTKLY